jgi:glutamate racemase
MIGVFDSGIGGLTVVKALRERLPDHDILYFGDTARTPYGNKSPDTVIQYALEDTRFLLNRGAQMVIMACNTASSVAPKAVAGQYDVALFEVITPAVAMALKHSRTGRVGVIGTRATVASDVYREKIADLRPEARVYSAACPLLVPLVEEGWLKRPETAMIVKKYLYPLKIRQIDTLILGCTHYPLLKQVIQRKIGKRVRIVDSSVSVAGEVQRFLEERPDMDARLSKTGQIHIAVSDITPQFEKIARATLKSSVSLEAVRL